MNAQANGVAPELGADDSAGQQAVTTSLSSRRPLDVALRGLKTECPAGGGGLESTRAFLHETPTRRPLEESSLRFAGLRTAPADFTASLVMLQAVRIGQREWRKY